MADRVGVNSRRTATEFINVSSATAPTVTTGNAFSLPLTADTTVANWSIVGGADKALFSISGGNLTMTAKNVASPADANADNIYEVTVEAKSVRGFKRFTDFKVKVVP